MHPLRNAAVFLAEAGQRIEGIAFAVQNVPILGEYLSIPFYYVATFLYEVARSLSEADDWISGFSFDFIIDNFRIWVMNYLGASPWDFIIFDDDLFGFCLYLMGLPVWDAKMASYDLLTFLQWRMLLWWGFLEGIAYDAAGWIKDQIIDRWPILEGLFDDPIAWVMYRLGADMFEVLAFRDDIPAWIFYRLTGSYVDALFYKWNLIEYVKWKLRSHWPFLDDLLLDPFGWFWYNLREAVDTYIDAQIDWVIQTTARVINLIWEARI